MPEIEIKYLRPDVVPTGSVTYQTKGANAVDLRAAISDPIKVEPGQAILIPSGIAIWIKNPQLAAVIIPRSGLGAKKGLVLGNLVGLIDSDYQGEIMITAWNRNTAPYQSIMIEPGQRLAQMVFVQTPRVKFREVEEFTNITERGTEGFGSTGDE